jgi:hypothetical protein
LSLFDFLVLFEKFVEQYRVHLVVTNAVRFSVVASNVSQGESEDQSDAALMRAMTVDGIKERGRGLRIPTFSIDWPIRL